MGEEQLRERCLLIARQVLADRGWGLVTDEDAFIDEMLAEVQRRQQRSRLPLEMIIKHATINRYCHLWYQTCKGGDVISQRRALRELHRYLYRVALHCADGDEYIAEESAQEALIDIWRTLDQVVDPGSFLGYARITVCREVKAQFKKRARKTAETDSGELVWKSKETTETDLTVRGGSEETGPGTPGIGGQPDPSAHRGPKMTDEMRDRLKAGIQQCLNNEQQQAVIIGLFLDEASFKELAEMLHTTPDYISVLKHRALAYLRECEAFLLVLEDLL